MQRVCKEKKNPNFQKEKIKPNLEKEKNNNKKRQINWEREREREGTWIKETILIS